MAILTSKGRRNVAAIVMAGEAMLSLSFNAAGVETLDQIPGRHNPHEERRRIEENRRETSFTQRPLASEIHTL